MRKNIKKRLRSLIVGTLGGITLATNVYSGEYMEINRKLGGLVDTMLVVEKQSPTKVYAELPLRKQINGWGELSTWMSADYSKKKENSREIKAGFTYSKNFRDVPGLSGKLTTTLLEKSESGNNDMFTLDGKLKYNKPINDRVGATIKLGMSQRVGYDDINGGMKFSGGLELPVKVYEKGDFDATLTPGASTSSLRNWYGSSGMSHLTPEFGLTIRYGKGSLNLYADKNILSRDDSVCAKLSINCRF